MLSFDRRFRGNQYSVEPIAHSAAHDFIKSYHYTKGMSNTAIFTHGMYDDLGALMGVAVWLCPTMRACKTVDPEDWKRVVSLSRLAVHPLVPKNAGSFLIARSIDFIRRDGRYRSLVSFADSSQGHTGHVYKASGWTYMGPTAATPYWVDPKTGRMMSVKVTRNRTVQEMRDCGYEFRGRFVKHKFVRYLDKRLHRMFCEL